MRRKPELWISSLKTGVKGDQVPFKSLLRHSKAVADGGILGATAPNPPLLALAYPSLGLLTTPSGAVVIKQAEFLESELTANNCQQRPVSSSGEYA